MIQYHDLIDKFRHALDERWGYILNTAGIIWTQDKQDDAERQYENAVARNDQKAMDRWGMAALNAAGTPLTFMWELETPLTYSLTPVEITTLLGTNTVFSDAGNISVEYCKDPNHTNVPQIVECGGGHYADANNTRVLFYCVAQNAANKQWQYAQRDTSAAYTEQELDTLQWNDLPSASDSGVLGLLAFATNGMFHYADASILENGDLVRCKVTGGKGAVVYSDPIQLEDLIIEVETAPGTPN